MRTAKPNALIEAPTRDPRLIDSHWTPLDFFRFFRRRLLSLNHRFLASELQKDLFKTHRRGPQFVEFPAGCHHGAREIAAHEILVTFDLEGIVAIVTLFKRYVANSRNLGQ